MENQESKDSLKPLIDQLKLTIKGVMLLSEQNQEISRYNIVKMLMEDDIQVKEFFASVIVARNQRFKELLITGIGQFIMAAILFIAGTLFLYPSLSPNFSLKAFLSYYSNGIAYYGESSGILYVSVVISFLLSVFLLVSAFYTIRVAKNSLLTLVK